MTNNLEREIQMVLEENEEVLWHSKQNLKATMVLSVVGIVVFLVVWLFLNFLASGSWECTINWEPAPTEKCNKIIRYISYGAFVLAIFPPIYSYLSYMVTNYVVTNKRILIKSWLLGADIRSIYYDQINNTYAKVNLIGKIFGTWTVLIDTWRVETTNEGGSKTVYDKISNVDDPYKVYQTIQSKLSERKENLYSWKAAEES